MKVLLRAPLLTNSGYGVHSRQIFEWLYEKQNIELKFSSQHHSFINSLNDDLNTAEAIGAFFSFLSEINKKNSFKHS